MAKPAAMIHGRMQLKRTIQLLCLSTFLGISACQTNPSTDSNSPQPPKLFKRLPASQTNIKFVNKLVDNPDINILAYQYFYNGGGVCVGDINNDGLPDIYFVGNLARNQLYLNKGNMQFEEISEAAGVSYKFKWATGGTMADVNNDGWLDIYVCHSGLYPDENRANKLFINNRDNTFTEMAEAYGLAHRGYATQAAFFDYDRDGDLDMYLLNHNIENQTNIPGKDIFKIKEQRHPLAGDVLYRNDGEKFTDVTEAAGIVSNAIGYGLGVSTGDVDNDGWPDIYVGNDYFERDYLYLNNGDGTFRETLKGSMKHTSNFSMGTDMADFNNDGWVDIVVADMVAEDNYRQKTNMSAMNIEEFWNTVRAGFHYQYMMNTLQLNNGNGSFSDISKLAGVSNTDWSWAPLLADFDNDGYKDLLITNGLRKDFRNNDFNKFRNKRLPEILANQGIDRKTAILELLDQMPSEKIRNYIFRNKGDLTFENASKDWGLTHGSYSNGAAYADLDNDGDLDLIINNVDHAAFIYENQTQAEYHYLQVSLKGPPKNTFGVGTRITLTQQQGKQVVEQYPTRGYQSSVSNILHFGLGANDKIAQLTVVWPDGKEQQLSDIKGGRRIIIDYADARDAENEVIKSQLLFTDATSATGIDFRHRENKFDDFRDEVLLPHRMSTWGPGIAVGDVNGDGLDDFYVGGAKGFAGRLYWQQADQTFKPAPMQPWEHEAEREDMGAVIFDSDGDGDQDLYVVSGGYDVKQNSPLLEDRLYLNLGQGRFQLKHEAIPVMFTSGSCVVPGDFDGDGDPDLFVGGRAIPGKYPFPPRSYILQNDKGIFTDITREFAPGIAGCGMVTAALWTDFDKDDRLDLLVTGEWMPLMLFRNSGEALVRDSNALEGTEGWWFSLQEADINQDGYPDYVAGNLGLNYKYKASAEEPFQIFCSDFDDNGSFDIVLGYYNQGSCFPVRGRQCLSEQMPFITEKFANYHDFGSATLNDVYGPEKLKASLNYQAYTFASAILINNKDGTFERNDLPNKAQVSSTNGIIWDDFDGDGLNDIVLAGNLHHSEVETPRNDAGIGLFLKGNPDGTFEPIPARESGFFADKDVKALAAIRLGKTAKGILVANNNDILQLIRVNQPGEQTPATTMR